MTRTAQRARHPALTPPDPETLVLDTPQIVQTAEQRFAFVRVTVPRSAIRDVMGPSYQELLAGVAAQGVVPTGPWFTHHLSMTPEVFDFELGVPVAAPITAAGRIEPGLAPVATVARAVYHGPFEGLAAAWPQLDAWIVAAGHTPAADLWECYVAGPESSPDPATWRTELTRPLVD